MENMGEGPRYCFIMCDSGNETKIFGDHFVHDINTITWKVFLGVVQLAVFLYFVTPVLFRYSLTLRRHILFCHSVGLNLLLRSDYFDPVIHGLEGGRNFYLKSESKEWIRLGVWHLLPKSLLGKTSFSTQPSEYWNEALRSSGKPVFVYFHGAIGTRATGFRIELYKLLQELDYHVIAFDYRGFGDSTQCLPSETRAVEDGLIVYNWLCKVLGKGSTVPIFFWGHSLGTGVTNHLAALLQSGKNESGNSHVGIVLESPFTNMKEEVPVHLMSLVYFMWPSWIFDWFFVLPLETTDILFENDRHILNIKVPVLILHATNDIIVPYRLGRKLYNIAWNSQPKRAQPVHFTTFKGFGPHTSHSYICRSPKLPGILKDFEDSCLKATNLNNEERNGL